MNEFVLGTGHQRNLADVFQLVESHFRRVEGIPRKLTLRGRQLDVIAEREGFEGPWDRVHIRLANESRDLPALRAAAEALGPLCEVGEKDGHFIVHCPAKQDVDANTVHAALLKLSSALHLPEVWRVAGGHYRVEPISVELLFQAMVQYRASDIHLSPGVCPVFRVDNDTHHSELLGPLSAVQIRELIYEIAPEKFRKEFESEHQTSFNYHQLGVGYARVSAFIKSGSPHCTFRYLPERIPSFDELQVPADTMTKLAKMHRGLLLVTGMTGSGKTTTCAALIDWINAHNPAHILTIENPIEYVHVNKKSVISQRALGADVNSFDEAVRGALRHDPDVIVIGEMRDADTIRSAINAAATGHLVISTLHSNSASEVVNRIVSFFDPVERDLVRLQLRDALKCVICQRLIPMIGGGRIPALEIMFNDVKAIADGIMEGNSDQIRIGMQQSVSHSFMFEQYLHKLYKQGKITLESAQDYSTDQSMFDQINMGTYSIPRLDSIRGGH